MLNVVKSLVAAKATTAAATKVVSKVLDNAVERADARRNPHRTRRTATKSAVPAAVVGGALAYYFDPSSGSSRRRSLTSRLQSLVGKGKTSPSLDDVKADDVITELRSTTN